MEADMKARTKRSVAISSSSPDVRIRRAASTPSRPMRPTAAAPRSARHSGRARSTGGWARRWSAGGASTSWRRQDCPRTRPP